VAAQLPFARRLTRWPADGQVRVPPNGACTKCGTGFSRGTTTQDGRITIDVTHYPVSQGSHFLIRTGRRCFICRMELLGPGPEERAEMALEGSCSFAHAGLSAAAAGEGLLRRILLPSVWPVWGR
jgi:hypothetical protein